MNKKIKKTKLKEELSNRSEIFYSLIAYFIGIFFINLAGKNISLNPIYGIESLASQIQFVLKTPLVFNSIIGFLLTLVPLGIVYIIFRELRLK